MQSFLSLCAEYFAKDYAEKAGKICVILPTRRSGMVLKQLLQAKKVKNLPEITHIEDFISSTAGMETPVQVMLLLELFDVFSKIDTHIKLEKFTGWGYILLKDFDLIDRNLVDAEQLFQNLSDIKNMERWRLGEDKMTTRIGEYFKLWENLNQTYKEFKARLQAQNQAYSGMMYRHLAENAASLLVNHPLYEKFIFIGFNALSKAEEKIFKTLIDAQKAEIIWDADEYYMNETTENKAGLFLKKYRKNWASTNWLFQSSYLLNSAKDIQIIHVANASMQGKVANQLLKNRTNFLKKPENKAKIPATALVLADENILMSVLNALDERFAGLNITIGLSLKDSALFNLVDVLFEQYQTSIRDKENKTVKFSHRSVIKLLSHPFIRQFEKRKCQSEEKSLVLMLIYFINKNNLIFIGKDDLLSIVELESFQEKLEEAEIEYCRKANELLKPLLEVLFAGWKNTFQILECFIELQDLLYNEENFFEAAYFREFKKILGQLRFFVERKPKFIDMRSFKIFLYQAFREAKFDFDSDKDFPLQLMGIVETRNLDFENVIILSLNESILPRSKKQNSFIPLDICHVFEIPTYTEQDAVISYHFYRLLQRAKNIDLVYVSPSDTYGAKEKSRFILQLENDLQKQNKAVKIRELPARFKKVEDVFDNDLIFDKDEEIIQKMKENFEKGLTPSHINSFVNCSLQYYFNQIADIGKSIKIEETLGADKLGTLVHEILEDIYAELSASPHHQVNEAAIQAQIPTIQKRVEEKFNLEKYANYLITGQNYITKQVTSQLIIKFLESQIEEIEKNGVPFEILTLENKEINPETKKQYSPTISASVLLQIEDENIPLTIKGITDRIDKVSEKVRIIDYKTGKVESSQLKISKKDLDKLVDDAQADKVRQLWLYKYIVAKRIIESGEFQLGEYKLHENENISAGIYSLRNTEAGFLELESSDKQESTIFPETLREYVKVSEEYLSKIIRNMLDKERKFEKTPNLDTCKFCAYKDICGR